MFCKNSDIYINHLQPFSGHLTAYLESTTNFDSVHIRHHSDAEVVSLEERLEDGTIRAALAACTEKLS
ncbi:MAG: hypothetical protein DI585_06330 [Pseudomonas fluorescens]|nr:MAG: hypothetical protein DI585_06330 [Pseudomonas fluorescens]